MTEKPTPDGQNHASTDLGRPDLSVLSFRSHKELDYPKTLEGRIINNFSLAYQFSHGDTDLRDKLMVDSSFYGHSIDTAIRREFRSLDELDQRLFPQVAELGMNFGTVEGAIPGEFQNRWSVQLHILEPLFILQDLTQPYKMIDEFYNKLPGAQCIDIATRMALVDLEMLEGGSIDDLTGEPFESQIKRFIIDSEPTGSEEFDRLFHNYSRKYVIHALKHDPSIDDIDNIHFATLGAQLRRLRKKWEDSHPGEIFYSELTPVTLDS